jgi:hypothetical protein
MASSAKSPAPPSIYNKMASMASASPAPEAKPPDADLELEGMRTRLHAKLMTVVDKWGQSNKEASPYAEKVMAVLKDYTTTVLKKKPEELMGGDQPAPPPAPGPWCRSSSWSGLPWGYNRFQRNEKGRLRWQRETYSTI